MSREQKDQADEIRGNAALQIINAPLFREAMIAIRAEYTEAFAKTKFHQTAERDELWRKMQTADMFEKYLKKVIATGKLGAANWKQKRKLKQLKII